MARIMRLNRQSLVKRRMVETDPFHRLSVALGRTGLGSSDFDLNPGVHSPDERVLRPAAVLVPFIIHENRMQVVLTKRSSALRHHPGQIAFPGGKVDESDANIEAAALREAHEEIGLSPDLVEVLHQLKQVLCVKG